MRVIVFRGDAQPKIVNGAEFVVTMTDGKGTRTLTSAGPDAPWREYPVSTTGTLRVQVTVRGETPYVRGDASAVIPLQPDLFLGLFVYAWSPSRDERLHGCTCPHRVTFPLRADSTTVQDSLVIAWEHQRRSRPNPPH